MPATPVTTDINQVLLQPVTEGSPPPGRRSSSKQSLLDVGVIPYRNTSVRFLVLGATSIMMFGSYYFFDQCSATQDDVVKHLNISEPQFGLLQSIYSWPNTVLPLFGGALIDSIGIRKSMALFMAFVALGQIVYTIGLSFSSFYLSLCGRAIFGLGGESLNVSALSMIALWFSGKELAFAMGIVICVSRLGSVAAFNSQHLLIEMSGVAEASTAGTFIMIFACFGTLGACIMDKHADKKDNKNKEIAAISSPIETRGGEGGDSSITVGDTVDFGKLMDLPKIYWLITFCCVTVYVSAFPFFQVISADYLKDFFGFSKGKSEFVTSLPNLVSAFTGPFLGLFVDKFGRRPYFLIASTLVFISCFISFISYGECQGCNSVTFIYVLLGMAICLFGSVMWPCIPLVVPDEMVGSAFGATTAVQNLGLGLAPLLFMELKTNSGGNFNSSFGVIIGCNLAALIASFGILKLDKKTGEKLQKP